MANTYFQFKQFTVHHDICAMKVGTDGVLLGAWTDVKNARRILDVGTGSGILALMMAQRNLSAEILAIDVNDKAVKQAVVNIKNSPFSDKIKVDHVSFQQLATNNKYVYDLIVTNPPYFVDSLKSPDKSRTEARHSTGLNLNDLFYFSKQIISENGSLSMILPFDQKMNALAEANSCGWFLLRSTDVYPKPNSKPKRVLLEFTTNEFSKIEEELTIEIERHIYSEDYISLTKDFYIKM